MLKIRRPLGRLIFNIGIAIPGKTVFLIETAPWCQRCSMGIISGLLYGQSVISTTWFSRKSVVTRAGTKTKLFWKVALAQGEGLCCSIRLYTCWFMVPFSTNPSLLPPKWNPAHTTTDGPTLPSVPCTQTSMRCPSPCHLRPEPVHLCDATLILTRQWRYSVTSGECHKHDDF